MPRTISQSLFNHLQGSTLTLTLIILITRLDGTVFGYTTLPQPVVSGGVIYTPLDSLDTASMTSSTDTDTNDLDITGILSAQATLSDFIAGKFDLATVVISMTNYMNPAETPCVLKTGFIGEVTLHDISYLVAVQSYTKFLKQTIGEITSQSCRATFGDPLWCQAVVHTENSSINTFDYNNPIQVIVNSSQGSGYYTRGKVTSTSGQNSGLTRDIQNSYLGSDPNGGGALIPQGGSKALTFQRGSGANATYPSWIFLNSNSQPVATSNPKPQGLFTGSTPITVSGVSVSATNTDPADYSTTVNVGSLPLGTYEIMYFAHLGLQWSLQVTVVPSSAISPTTNLFTLQEPFPYPFVTGDTVTLFEGCLHDFPTCQTKTPPAGTTQGVGNSVNFQGEPDLPGNDQFVKIGR